MTKLARYLVQAAERRRNRRAKLPWQELEAEAARQGCDPADIFFDRAGHRMPGLPTAPNAVATPAPSDSNPRSSGACSA